VRRRWLEPAEIAAEIDRIRSLRLDPLRRQWRRVFGRVPPAGLSKDLLGRMIVARLQERALGGLDRDSLRFLQSLAQHARAPRRPLKPGTVLVREYQGRRHTVTTVRNGFDWEGTTYPSLSAIARAITGTAWSGPRFFALKGAGDGSKPKRRPAAGPDDGRLQRKPSPWPQWNASHKPVGASLAPCNSMPGISQEPRS
jgi:Protein of unknown function (DUF2924)